MSLSDQLLEAGAVSAEALQRAEARRRETGAALGDVLLENGDIEEEALLAALARQFHCEWLRKIDPEWIEGALLEQVPVEYARQRLILPLRYKKEIAVVTSNPAAAVGMDDLTLLLGTEPQLLIASRSQVLRGIEHGYFQQKDRNPDALVEAEGAGTERVHETADLLRSSDAAPVTQWVNNLLLDALKLNASDVHIEPFDKRIRVRFRIDGVLAEQPDAPKSFEANLTARFKIMAKLDIAEKRLPQDGMARVSVGEREIDIRMSTVPVAEGERVVLRLLRHDTGLLPLKDLGMTGDTHARFLRLLREPHGVIWVTGPTGSGKTTTLYSGLQLVDTDRKNVMTIEDPIEYQLHKIGQIAVKPKIGLGFAEGLRHILRQDPDIILVGETRDAETADIVVRASLTGHLVFSTLHTNDSLAAVPRLIDMGVEPYLVAESTCAAMAQRLLRKLCDRCATDEKVQAEEVVRWGSWSEPLAGKSIRRAVGCEACRDGYSGRIGIFELNLFSPEMKDAIRQGISMRKLRQMARRAEGETLHEAALAKIRRGETDPNEVLAVLGGSGHETMQANS